MKTTTKYLCFEELETSTKTKKFLVTNKIYGSSLGYIKWFASWRKYCFFPGVDLVFDAGCLADIQSFMNTLMDERRKQNESNCQGSK